MEEGFEMQLELSFHKSLEFWNSKTRKFDEES